MAAAVVLDTSFLITLVGAGRQHHPAARQYWRHFTEIGIPIYQPTIMVSEFAMRQDIPPGILRSCVVLPFNWDDAIQAARLDFSKDRNPDDDRHALKDDLKILAQAIVKDAAFTITDDTRTFYRYARRLHEEGGDEVLREDCLWVAVLGGEPFADGGRFSHLAGGGEGPRR